MNIATLGVFLIFCTLTWFADLVTDPQDIKQRNHLVNNSFHLHIQIRTSQHMGNVILFYWISTKGRT